MLKNTFSIFFDILEWRLWCSCLWYLIQARLFPEVSETHQSYHHDCFLHIFWLKWHFFASCDRWLYHWECCLYFCAFSTMRFWFLKGSQRTLVKGTNQAHQILHCDYMFPGLVIWVLFHICTSSQWLPWQLYNLSRKRFSQWNWLQVPQPRMMKWIQ